MNWLLLIPFILPSSFSLAAKNESNEVRVTCTFGTRSVVIDHYRVSAKPGEDQRENIEFSEGGVVSKTQGKRDTWVNMSIPENAFQPHKIPFVLGFDVREKKFAFALYPCEQISENVFKADLLNLNGLDAKPPFESESGICNAQDLLKRIGYQCPKN